MASAAPHEPAAERPDHDLRRRVLLTSFTRGVQEFSRFLTESVNTIRDVTVASDSEVFVMTAIRLAGAMRPRDLQPITGFTSGGITNLVDRLEAGGLVRRTSSDDGDQRGVLIELTTTGEEVVDEFATAYARVFRVSRPLLERFAEMLGELGVEVARIRSWGDGRRRSDLVHIRDLESAGHLLSEALGKANDGDPKPARTFHVLALLTDDDALRPRRIAEVTQLSSAATSELLTRLEQRGLVRRGAHPGHDRRGVVVTITPAGRALLDSMLDTVEERLPEIAGAFFPA